MNLNIFLFVLDTHYHIRSKWFFYTLLCFHNIIFWGTGLKKDFFFSFSFEKKIRLHMHHRIKSKNPLKIGFSSKKVSLTGYELIQEKCQISNKVPFFKMKVWPRYTSKPTSLKILWIWNWPNFFLFDFFWPVTWNLAI